MSDRVDALGALWCLVVFLGACVLALGYQWAESDQRHTEACHAGWGVVQTNEDEVQFTRNAPSCAGMQTR